MFLLQLIISCIISAMQKKKLRVAILFGGKSAEHEVSIQSAKNVYNSLDKKKYDITLIGIDKKGEWHVLAEKYLMASSFTKELSYAREKNKVSDILPSPFYSPLKGEGIRGIDVVFPVLHGPYGEDGSMQGLLQISNVSFVGPGVLGSAIGMDKDVTKRLLRDAGLPVAKFLVFQKSALDHIVFRKVAQQLGVPFFVKPANLGSSVGVSKVHNEKEFATALEEAFTYDNKILLEQYIQGKEIECSVLGNDTPIVSIPGEIIAHHEFYSYEAKYLDENGAELKIPAGLPAKKVKEVQQLALQVFKILCLESMARIDFFYTPEGKFYVNEANTIPGFTNISMYPKLWEASGISYSELVDRLLQLAIERQQRQNKLRTSR